VSGFAVANVLFYTLGIMLILVLPTSDLIGSIMTVAFGTAGLAFLLGDETDNAFADVYSGVISIKNVLPTLSTRALVTAIGGVCLSIALTVDLASFQGFLYLRSFEVLTERRTATRSSSSFTDSRPRC